MVSLSPDGRRVLDKATDARRAMIGAALQALSGEQQAVAAALRNCRTRSRRSPTTRGRATPP